SVRERAPHAPRWIAAVVRVCLRSKPKQRFPNTADLRRLLERRLGQPSPADCRTEIAGWLAASGALPQPKARTRRAARKPDAARAADADEAADEAARAAAGGVRAPRWRVAALLLALLGVLAWAGATTSFVRIERLGPWLARNDASEPAEPASGVASAAARAEAVWARVRGRVTRTPGPDPAAPAPPASEASETSEAGVAASARR
ncbi:MAG TPA: hypothetical protein VFZ18_13440, partial [Longimicrobiaceae bacterium]